MADEVKGFTPEQRDELSQMIGGQVSNMLSARIKTMEKGILDKVGPSVGESIKAMLPELVKELRPAGDSGSDGDGKGGKGGKGRTDDVELATLRKRVEEMAKSNTDLDSKWKAAEGRRREIERQKRVSDQLHKNGITDPFQQELALSYLDRKGRVVDTGEDDSALLWKGDDGIEVAFDDGMRSWLKTPEARHFMPPTGAAGSGARRAASPTRETPKKDVTYEDVGNFVLGISAPSGGTPLGE